MGIIHRQDFSGGWNPSMDLVNSPPNFLPRADNLVLDDQGALVLRRGLLPWSSDILQANGQVHKLYTMNVDGFRFQYAALGLSPSPSGVWRSNGGGVYSQILSNFAGTGDIRLGDAFGQLFAARGVTKFKNDPMGGQSRVWGVDAPTARPTLTAIAPDEKTFSTFAAGETPAWVASDGTIASGSGFDDSPDGARLVTCVKETGIGTITKVLGAEQNFTNYDAGDTGTDDDLVDFYVWMSSPSALELFTIQFDINGDSNSPAARFRDDYFYVEVTPDQALSITPAKVDYGTTDEPVPPYRRDNLENDRRRNKGIDESPEGAKFPRNNPRFASAGWAHFSIPRGSFIRVGSTPTKGWNTVKAISVTAQFTPSTTFTYTYKVDNLRIIGGARHPYSGRYRVAIQYVSELSKYTAKSGLSPISEEIDLKANALRVNFSIPSTAHGWITGVRIYLSGGTLPGFYMAKLAAAVTPSSGSQNYSITVNTSDRDLLIQNSQADPNITTPPDDILDIAGPFDSRLFVLSEDGVSPSLQNDPDAYSLDNFMPIPGGTAFPWWLKNVVGEPILGTGRDIYRIAGDGSTFPDGTINYRYEALNVPPPISDFVAQEGNLLIYLAADGLRVFNGTSSTPLTGGLDLLFQGQTRYGVEPPNLGSAPGRFRGGIFNNRLYVLWPEGSTNPSNVIYVLDLGSKQWRRTAHLRSFYELYREPDGKLMVGDSAGMIYRLEARDGGDLLMAGIPGEAATESDIPVVLWTRSDDGEAPLNFKEPEDFRLGGAEGAAVGGAGNMNVALHLDESPTPAASLVLVPGGQDLRAIETIGSFKRAQVRLTGQFTSFKLRSWSLTYRRRPAPRSHYDSGFIRLSTQTIVHLRRLIVLARVPVDVTVKVYFDETLVATDTILANPVLSPHEVVLGREVYGRQIRITFTVTDALNTSAFEPYWIDMYYRPSGRQAMEKKFILIDGDKLA